MKLLLAFAVAAAISLTVYVALSLLGAPKVFSAHLAGWWSGFAFLFVDGGLDIFDREPSS